ncbi:MAG: hypothetical protein IPM95_05220 [Sphingobacteriales bacterium]|nr:hypothetical protein [Sphingobacteriales bacterium]
MKKVIFMAMAMFSIFMFSCKKETLPVNETEGLVKVQEMSNDTNIVELYTKTGSLQVGYNEVYLRIRDKKTAIYKTDAVINWSPLMHMMAMTHSCPKSAIAKVAGKTTVYKGFIVFQMPENATERWTLSLNFQTGGASSSVEDTVSVPNSVKKRVSVFTGSDTKKYIVALAEPANPAVAVNDLVVGLFTMESMMSFPAVTDFTIEMDPRMPSMGNHSSPNNENPVFSATDNLYHGKLSLTMTGYWKLNLIVKNASSEVVMGEAVTVSNESSSLFLEVEI